MRKTRGRKKGMRRRGPEFRVSRSPSVVLCPPLCCHNVVRLIIRLFDDAVSTAQMGRWLRTEMGKNLEGDHGICLGTVSVLACRD
jgi:hypothetical protein